MQAVDVAHCGELQIDLRANRSRIAGAGAVDTTFNVVPNNAVYSVLTLPNGKILIGGAFTMTSAVPKMTAT